MASACQEPTCASPSFGKVSRLAIIGRELAAYHLHHEAPVRLGFTTVADLIGGHTAWAAEGLPVVRPDHSHLDTPSFDEPDFNAEQ